MQQLTGTAPEYIDALFFRGGTGTVEMVNSRGIYLQLEGKHILLCHSRYGTVPNGVALNEWELLPSVLVAGQPVRVEKRVLYTPSGTWQLRLRKIPRDTQILLPTQTQLRTGIEILLAEAKQTGLSRLVYPLFTGESGSLNIYCETALPHIKDLLQAIQEENTAQIRQTTSNLLGLGPGLTPSADDLLSGLLYGLRHGPARDTAVCNALCAAIGELAGNRTNAVSADYLYALAEDSPFDCMAAAWRDPAAGAAGLIQIGNNSGTEMFLGLLCAAALQLSVFAKKQGK